MNIYIYIYIYDLLPASFPFNGQNAILILPTGRYFENEEIFSTLENVLPPSALNL